MTLDDRLRIALNDLDQRVQRHLGASAASGPATGPATPAVQGGQHGRRRGPVPAVAALAVMVLLLGGAWLLRADLGRHGNPPARHGIFPTPTRTVPAPSQSPADAARDGVPASIAKLTVAQRVSLSEPYVQGTVTQAHTPEGVWVVSALSQQAQALVRQPDYGELLLLNATRSRILKAYPMASVAPHWLLVTPSAVYCGRQGDGGLPDSMVCRVDRATLTLTVRVFFWTDGASYWTAGRLRGRPGHWSAQPTSLAAYCLPRLGASTLGVSCSGQDSTRLDPVTLVTRR